MASLMKNDLIRQIILPIFARINPGNITIRHHFTGQKLYLHSFRHKNYWVHGKNRERRTMDLFGKIIKEGQTIIELGAHIGYISLYFAHLVGDDGHVFLFEPGPDNFEYLSRNIAHNKTITAIQKAVSDTNGTIPFFIESFSGQNNTLIEDFAGLEINSQYARVKSDYSKIMVDVVTLDTVIPDLTKTVDFIKIDVEGVEYKVLQGAKNTIAQHLPIVMVESIDTDAEVLEYFTNLGYVLISPEAKKIKDASEMEGLNYFCVHPEKHNDAYRILLNMT